MAAPEPCESRRRSGSLASKHSLIMASKTENDSTVIPLLEEKVTLNIRDVEKSKTRITTVVEHHEAIVDALLRDEEIEIRRVAIGRVVFTAPVTRQDGDTMIIPVLSEEVVVEKRLVLKEELHVTRRCTAKPLKKAVMLRSERAEVERVSDPSSPPKS